MFYTKYVLCDPICLLYLSKLACEFSSSSSKEKSYLDYDSLQEATCPEGVQPFPGPQGNCSLCNITVYAPLGDISQKTQL